MNQSGPSCAGRSASAVRRRRGAVRRYRATGDRAVRNELITLFSAVADRLARRYASRGEPQDDLLQVARLGLLKAVERFDPARGVPFEGFATPTITGELKRHFRDATWSARVGRKAQELNRSVSAAVETLNNELGRSPTIIEIAERLAVTRDDVLSALEARNAYRARSLDAVPADEDGTPLGARLGGEDADIEQSALRQPLSERISRLGERERRLLHLRFEQELTQSQIAEELGISQMHVSRLLRRTLDALRQTLDHS
ncbi:MAG: SigB/SigF/SigG family RNA polymerase sigma factor [Alphaproteobacteria bacterium]